MCIAILKQTCNQTEERAEVIDWQEKIIHMTKGCMSQPETSNSGTILRQAQNQTQAE